MKQNSEFKKNIIFQALPQKGGFFILIDMRLVDKMIKQTEEAQNNKSFIQHVINLMDKTSKEGYSGVNIGKGNWNSYLEEYFKNEGFSIEETLSFIRIRWDKSVVEQEECI